MTHTDRPTQPGEEAQELPSVSVVIPAYNAAETIERALNSVYAQTYPNITEVIVVDDGCTDATAEVVAGKFPQVILIRQENQGNAAARNRGVEEASGEYIAFLDADDEWFPNKLEVQVPIVLRHPGISLLTCWFTDLWADGTPAPQRFPDQLRGPLRDVTFRDWVGLVAAWAAPSTPGMLLRRDLYIAVGGMDTAAAIAEDWEFVVRLSGLGYSTVILCEPLYYRYLIQGSVTHSPGNRRLKPAAVIEVMSRYDPQSGLFPHLLTKAEYDAIMAKIYWDNGCTLWAIGAFDDARAHFRRAASLSNCRTGALRRTRYTLAAWCPSVSLALNAIAVRVLGKAR